jgi:hypothetical protein
VGVMVGFVGMGLHPRFKHPKFFDQRGNRVAAHWLSEGCSTVCCSMRVSYEHGKVVVAASQPCHQLPKSRAAPPLPSLDWCILQYHCKPLCPSNTASS